MELLSNLSSGFAVALTMQNLLFCFIGVMIGTGIGVLPGLGPAATLAMLLPITFHLEPTTALIMLAGIYYGAQYGGSITAILVNLPGEASTVVTCLDGYQMARKGRAGAALAIAAIGSFAAGSVATLLIAIASVPMSVIALRFGAPEYFSLMVFGLVGSMVLAHGSVLKAFAMVLLGLLLGLVGIDLTSGAARYTFGQPHLMEGIGLVPVAMGIFGLSEIINNLGQPDQNNSAARIGSLMPTRKEMTRSALPIARGTIVGSFLGALPGGGAMLSSFASYALEKKISRNPEEFGTGAIEGVAGPEAANNAGAQVSFIPMLTLGIPSNAVMALMIGALLIQGIVPGPMILTEQPTLVWGLIASMWIGNLMLLVINLPLVGVWVAFLKVPYKFMFPAILLLCSIGVYSINNSMFDVAVMAVFAVIGTFLLRLGFESAPLLLGFILGPMMEENLRRAMTLSRGSVSIFFTHPISLALIIASLTLLLLVLLPMIRRTRDEAFRED